MSKCISLADQFDLEQTLTLAVSTLNKPGAVLLVPTETLYGLVAHVDDAMAIAKIFRLKQRSKIKSLGWFIDDWRKLSDYQVELSGLPEKLAERYLPGALTIIAKCGEGTQGFRVPDHQFMLELLRRINVPLVQTSANISGMPDALNVQDALEMLTGDVDLIIDGGPLVSGAQGSTVVDATGEHPVVLRQGKVKIADL